MKNSKKESPLKLFLEGKVGFIKIEKMCHKDVHAVPNDCFFSGALLHSFGLYK